MFFPFLFVRTWMQWHGGPGTEVLPAPVMQQGLVEKGLAVTETESGDLVGGTQAHTQRVLKVYTVLNVLGIIGDPQFEGICRELGLKDTIIPSRTISRYLEDMVSGGENVELSTVIKDEARFFTLVAKKEDAVVARDLKLPADAKVICYYRDGKFSHADEDTKFRPVDEIVILTHNRNMSALQERWLPKSSPDEPEPEE